MVQAIAMILFGILLLVGSVFVTTISNKVMPPHDEKHRRPPTQGERIVFFVCGIASLSIGIVRLIRG